MMAAMRAGLAYPVPVGGGVDMLPGPSGQGCWPARKTSRDPGTVAKIILTFETLRSEALPRGASRDLILKVAGEFGRYLEEVQLQRR